MAAASERWRVLARAGEIEYDRVLFFSDAVFAIAITLLIVDLRVPDIPHVQSGQLLRHAIPQIGGFAYSFAAIGLFWLAHHGLFRHIKGLDRRLVLLNLLFLGTIAFVPYPTALLSAAGDQVPATVFYAASLAAVGLAEAAVWLYAIRIRELALPRVSPAVRRWVLLRILRTPVIFMLSIPVAVLQPNLASTCGCSSSSAGWCCAGWSRPRRSRGRPRAVILADEVSVPGSSVTTKRSLPCRVEDHIER
jgi:uncharacterized membrane protein